MNQKKPTKQPGEILTGLLVEGGVTIDKAQDFLHFSSRGYGTIEHDVLSLTYYEASYLLEKGMLDVKDEHDTDVSFQDLLHCYTLVEDNAWTKYLIYHDLRNRGYVVRDGFGLGIDFRVYKRGEYGKAVATYLVLILKEGSPILLSSLTSTLLHCQSLKKSLILAVMNRRGEIVYYSVAQLHLT